MGEMLLNIPHLWLSSIKICIDCIVCVCVYTDSTNFPLLRLGLFLFGHLKLFQWSFCILPFVSDVSFTGLGLFQVLPSTPPIPVFRCQ